MADENRIAPSPRKNLSEYLQSFVGGLGSRPSLVLVLISILVLIVSQLIRVGVPPEYRLIPLLLLPFSLAAFTLGIWAVEHGYLPGWFTRPLAAAATWLHVTPGQFFGLCFSLIFSVLTCIAAGFNAMMFTPGLALLCWVTAILLATVGGLDASAPRERVPLVVVIAALALFGIAFLLRAVNTATIPPVLTGDEAASGLYSLNFLSGKVNNLFVTGWFSFPTLHNSLQAFSIVLFGQTTQALRLLSAFAGALTVLLLFFVGRSLFGFVPGLMAAIFLAGMHYSIHFSRIGLNNIWDGFFFTLVLGFLWLGWQRNRRAAYLVAGLGLGLAQYFYTSSRLLFLIIPLWLLAAGWSDHERWKKAVPNLLLMLWLAFIVVLPLAWFYLFHIGEFFAPMNRVTILGSWMAGMVQSTGQSPVVIVLGQIWQGLLGYVEQPLNAWYQPGVPVLRILPGAVFLLGLPFLFMHLKDSRNQLLLIWLLCISVMVGLSESAPAAQRYVAAAPALALMIGFSLQQLGDLFARALPGRKIWIQNGLLILAFLLAADDAYFYFVDYTPHNDFGGFNTQVAQRLADQMRHEPAGVELVFCGYPGMGYDSIASLPYLAPQIHYYNMNQAWGLAGTPTPTGSRIFFAFLPGHDADQQAVEKAYPGGTWNEQFTTYNAPLYWLYEVNHAGS